MIITISREFGSGGRELGKRLSETLQIPCYDKEIIALIAKEQGLDERYLTHISEKGFQASYPLTIGRRFAMTPHPVTQQKVMVAVEQRKIIEQFAWQGDCVIIGRCADVILADRNPMNLFVYADMQSKLARCAGRAPEGEHLSVPEMKRRMRQVDQDRTAYRRQFSDTKWGRKEGYHLCINTSGKEIKALVPPLAEYVTRWFKT